MSDTGWLIVAIVAGALVAIGWVERELWIRRRRRRKRLEKGDPVQ